MDIVQDWSQDKGRGRYDMNATDYAWELHELWKRTYAGQEGPEEDSEHFPAWGEQYAFRYGCPARIEGLVCTEVNLFPWVTMKYDYALHWPQPQSDTVLGIPAAVRQL